MNRTFRKLAGIGFVLIALTAAGAASAGDGAQGFIQARQAEVTSLLREPAGTSRDKKISSVLDKMIDFDKLARRSLASHWDDLSENQRKEFTGILKQLVQRNYERNIKNILNYEVEYLGQDARGETKESVVHTKATSKTNQREEPIAIDYQLESDESGWRVVDIVTEGSSMVNNYKSQFNRIITKDGYEALIRRMKSKLAKGQGA